MLVAVEPIREGDRLAAAAADVHVVAGEDVSCHGTEFLRTTPAGRFDAVPGRNLLPEDVIWVDDDAAVSMHRLRTSDPRERRLERLATPTVDDNRISYGCINVPMAFSHWRPGAVARGRQLTGGPTLPALSMRSL